MTSPCAQGQALIPGCLDSHDAPHALLGGGCDPEEPDHLLGRELRDGCGALDRIARGDSHLGAECALPADDVAGDVLRQDLDQERFADDDLLDRLLEELGEARHVDALLGAVEVDGALDVGGDQFLDVAVPDADRLLDARDPSAGQAQPDLGQGGLEILLEKVGGVFHRGRNTVFRKASRGFLGYRRQVRPFGFPGLP